MSTHYWNNEIQSDSYVSLCGVNLIGETSESSSDEWRHVNCPNCLAIVRAEPATKPDDNILFYEWINGTTNRDIVWYFYLTTNEKYTSKVYRWYQKVDGELLMIQIEFCGNKIEIPWHQVVVVGKA